MPDSSNKLDPFYRIKNVLDKINENRLYNERYDRLHSLDRLFQEYFNIFNQYFYEIARVSPGSSLPPGQSGPFPFPYFLAYGLTLKNDILYLFCNGKKYILNERTLNSVFDSLGIPYVEAPANTFLEQIRTILSKYQGKLTAWNLYLLDLQKKGNHTLANVLLSLCDHCRCDDGHLVYFHNPGYHEYLDIYHANSIFHSDFTSLPFSNKDCKTVLYYMQEQIKLRDQVNGDPTPPIDSSYDLLYCNTKTSGVRFIRKGNKKGEDDLSCAILDNRFPHSLKRLAYSKPSWHIDSSSTLANALFAFTGGKLEQLDMLSALLANIASPAPPTPKKPSLSVVYTKYNISSFQDFLLQVFSKVILYSSSSTRQKSFRLLSAEGKKVLLSAQIGGKILVLLEPALPTHAKTYDFQKLIYGDRLSISSPRSPDQSFHNRLHFVVVTNDATLRDQFVIRYGASCVDLSAHEQPYSSAELSPEETNWVRSSLLLHGAVCKHRRKVKRPKIISAVPPHGDIQRFTELCCTFSPELRCSRSAFNDAYLQFYTHQYGTLPDETPTQFGKRFRKQMPETVQYKVARCPPEQESCQAYVGMAVHPPEGPPQKFLPSPKEKERFLAYLQEEIEPLAQILP